MPWFTWDGAWRLSVPAEIATAAMSAIVEAGAPLGVPESTETIRQLTRSLFARVQVLPSDGTAPTRACEPLNRAA